jgi:hypothetical protein
MSADLSFDADRNLLVLGERRLVFHCHHYNLSLQRTIDDIFGEEAAEMQVAAAAESAREMLSRVFAGVSRDARLALAGSLFGQNGFGLADLSAFGGDGGVVTLASSHYAVGWRSKWGQAERPVCHYATGYFAGALVAAFDLGPERVVAREERCAAVSDGPCRIRLEVR